ncbi:MAG: retinol dehydrogenase 12 [Acidimicrobiaceae bacterium]|nr:retinol dehydrogenase 12 [Acidimicrobiaceae bacterium]
MNGKVVVITGANSGIGKETAVALAAMGATTVLACRNLEKAAVAAEEVKERAATDDVSVVELDLADLISVRTAATTIQERWGSVDVLVNNAGGIWTRRQTTAQGFEQTFGVNHLAHFYLTGLLLDTLVASAPARIVNVSSAAHRLAVRGMRWDDLQHQRRYSSMAVYAETKLANLLFTRGLARRLDPSVVTANAVHPGPVRSGFGMDGDAHGLMALGNRLIRPFEVTPQAGADTVIFLAFDPSLSGHTGGYWANRGEAKMSRAAQSDDAAERLWAESERLLLGAGFPVSR